MAKLYDRAYQSSSELQALMDSLFKGCCKSRWLNYNPEYDSAVHKAEESNL